MSFAQYAMYDEILYARSPSCDRSDLLMKIIVR